MLRILIIIISLMAVAQLPQIHDVFLWQRTLIEQGQWWRILTGNLTHTNISHYLMNSAVLLLICQIFSKHLTEKKLLSLLCFLSLVIGIFICFTPINAYAGLSGILHGLFLWGAIKDIQAGNKSGWLLSIGVLLKVVLEQKYGGAPSSAALIGARVAVEAHLAGVIGGSIALLLEKAIGYKKHRVN